MLTQVKDWIQIVQDRDWSVQQRVHAIAEIRKLVVETQEYEEQAVATLLRLLDDNESIQIASMLALGRLRLNQERVLPALKRLLFDGKTLRLQGYAAIALGYFREEANEIVPVLIDRLLHGEETGTRICSAIALGHYGSSARSAVPALIGSLSLEKVFACRSNVTFLNYNEPDSSVMIPDLLEDFEVFPMASLPVRESQRIIREAAVEALGRIGQPAEDSVGGLLKILRREPPWLQRKAARAFGRIRVSHPEIITGLRRQLHHQNDHVRKEVVMSLYKLDQPDLELTLTLLDLFEGRIQDFCWVHDEAFTVDACEDMQEMAGRLYEELPRLRRTEMPSSEKADPLTRIELALKRAILELGKLLEDQRLLVRRRANEAWKTLQKLQGQIAHDTIEHWRGEYEQVLFG